MVYFLLWIIMTFTVFGNENVPNRLMTIAYHDIALSYENRDDSDCITQSEIIKQFQWLKENGYNVIHPKDLIDYQEGKKELPPKAVLLTFDDGYTSFYTIVYPLLRTFNYPAVLAVVGSWIEDREKGKSVSYDKDQKWAVDRLSTWSQIKEMVNSGLVEVASHSYKHHQGAVANPQGSNQPLFVTRIYDQKTGTYETIDHYKERIQKDLKDNQDCIFRHIGKKPRLMVWPYGRYNQSCIDAAKNVGLKIFFTLEDENLIRTPINFERTGRYYFMPQMSFKDFTDFVKNIHKKPVAKNFIPKEIVRAVHLDLDQIFINDSDCQANMDKLVDRLYKYQINAVIINGFSFENNQFKGLYFQNRHLPIKKDLLNEVAWKLRSRAGCSVFVKLPLSLSHMTIEDATHQTLSKQKIKEIYEDLAFNVPISGVVFQDEGILLPTKDLIEFSKEIVQAMKMFRLPVVSVQSLNADHVLQSNGLKEWYQNCDFILMTDSQQAKEKIFINDHLNEVFEKAHKEESGLQKTIFELQTLNWQNSRHPIDASDLLEKIRNLSAKGAFHFSLFPDNPIKNQPDIAIIKEAISKQSTIFIP